MDKSVMKKLALILVASLLLAQLLVALPSQAATPFRSPLVPAFSYMVNLKMPLDMTFFVPCALGGQGEDVHLSGDLHTVIHVTRDAHDTYHIEQHYQPQGISGVGMTSGAQYQATGITRSSENVVGMPYNYTLVNNFRIIGQGAGNNFLLHETFHITVNANGELTAVADNYSVDCK